VKTDKFFVLEESGFCCRYFFQQIHPFKMTMRSGPTAVGPIVASYDRPVRCAAGNCKCCCYQEIFAFDGASNAPIGSVIETFYFCIPRYDLKDKHNEVRYHIAIPECFGCLPNYYAEGCCRVPFYVYSKDDTKKHVGKIVRRWGSLGTELIGVHQFSTEFPAGSTAEEKALLLGGTYLLNEIYFKMQS